MIQLHTLLILYSTTASTSLYTSQVYMLVLAVLGFELAKEKKKKSFSRGTLEKKKKSISSYSNQQKVSPAENNHSVAGGGFSFLLFPYTIPQSLHCLGH